MKKGFTLIELLIVMVIVGVLVTVSLPKYRASMERGRATEGINNVRAISDAVNAKYVMNENSYSLAGLTDSNGNVTGVDMTKSVNFSTPKMTLSDATVTVTTTRTGSYTLTATNQNGELISIECTGGCGNLPKYRYGEKFLRQVCIAFVSRPFVKKLVKNPPAGGFFCLIQAVLAQGFKKYNRRRRGKIERTDGACHRYCKQTGSVAFVKFLGQSARFSAKDKERIGRENGIPVRFLTLRGKKKHFFLCGFFGF